MVYNYLVEGNKFNSTVVVKHIFDIFSSNAAVPTYLIFYYVCVQSLDFFMLVVLTLVNASLP